MKTRQLVVSKGKATSDFYGTAERCKVLEGKTETGTECSAESERVFSRQLVAHILEDDFEYGTDSKAHSIVKEQMTICASATKERLCRIYANNSQNPEILVGILRVIARFEPEEIYPEGQTMAIAALDHNDELVQETAIRAFEGWGGVSSLKILENATVSSDWVKEYLDGVISDLKEKYQTKQCKERNTTTV